MYTTMYIDYLWYGIICGMYNLRTYVYTVDSILKIRSHVGKKIVLFNSKILFIMVFNVLEGGFKSKNQNHHRCTEFILTRDNTAIVHYGKTWFRLFCVHCSTTYLCIQFHQRKKCQG